MKETKIHLDEENMKSFGKYEALVRSWCIKHNMFYVMEEFKELFEMIEKTKANRKVRER